jgi:hypothetical protein
LSESNLSSVFKEQERMPNRIRAILGLVLIAAVAGGAFAAVWWVASNAAASLSASEGGFVREAAFVAGALLLAVFFITNTLRKNTLLRVRERRRPLMLRLYRKVLDDIASAALEAVPSASSESEPFQQALRSDSGIARDMAFWSSPHVIRNYRRVWYSETPLELAERLDDILNAMRSDVGISSGLIAPGELLDLLVDFTTSQSRPATVPKPKTAEVRKPRTRR